MNNRIKRYLSVPFLAAAVAVAGCDKGLTDVNINPNEPEVVPPENLLANGIWQIVGDLYGTHGVWAGLYLSNIWSQHLASTVYIDEDQYQPRVAQVNDVWNTNFIGPMMDFEDIRRIGVETGDATLEGVAETMLQYGFLFMTDFYGDIPYSEALLGAANPNPKYDPQRDVYTGILTTLGTAAPKMNRATTFVSWAKGDLIYAGNVERWFRFANSLRLRAAMRVASKEPALAQQHVQAALQAGVLRNNADNARVLWSPTFPNQNPLFDYYVNQNRNDQVLSLSLVSRLQTLNDPRLATYASPAQADGVFRGLVNGVGASSSRNYSWPHQVNYLGPGAASLVLTYAEVLLYQAEAAARGIISGGAAAAANFYREGIRASMEEQGIGAAAITAYLAQPSTAYNGLPSIHLQQWLNLYLNGPEAWAHIRRTGSPQLTPSAGTQYPARLPYPPQEKLYNPTQYREVSLFEKVWWMP